ncbi:SH3 domain-containing protein [Psychrobacter sp. 1U1]|uniref:SH3 domain-containing protein n=2 Tax=unclassified Psychrobacter TaxID=196806 RepID=UPI003F459E3D
MDENSKKESKQLLALEIANKIQEQSVPFSGADRISNNLPRVAQYEQMNSAANIASKAFQQSSLMPAYSESQSAITKFAQSRAEEAVIFKDPSLDIMKIINSYDSLISNSAQKIAKTITELTSPMAEIMKPLANISQSIIVAADLYKQSEFAKEFYAISQSQEMSNLTLKMSEAIEQFNQISQMKSFEVLSGFNSTSLNEVLNSTLTQEDIKNFSREPISEIDSKLSDELKLGKDFSLYSDRAKDFLVYFYHIYLLQFLLGIASGLTTYYILQAQEETKTLTTQQEVKSFTRSSPITFDRNALKGHRFTMVNNLNLRGNHSMDSNVIEILPIGTIVKVIDKSNRSWLLVEIEIDDEVQQGWILRRYTTYFK